MRILFVLLSLITFAGTASANVIKMSSSRICHESNSPFYEQTRKYTAYATLEACIADGGRKPKLGTTTPTSQSAAQTKRYNRDLFGKGWGDEDGNCRNTRAEVLLSTSTVKATYSDPSECRVEQGQWISSFTGQRYYHAKELDIDHVVPLKWAWDNGADRWTSAMREKFANDPANLLPVEARLNRQKGAQDISQWLPPKNQCAYIARFLRVMKTYNIELPPKKSAEFDAIRIQHCRK